MMMWLRLEPLSQPKLLIVVMRLLCSLPSSHCRFNQRSNELRFEPRRVVVRILAHLLDAVGSNRLLAGVPGRKIEAMTKVAEALLADALRLSPEVRAELAAELLASLDGPTDPDAEAAWTAEIERRVDAIEAGTAALEPWEDAKRRIEKDILGR
jgi:putative addiction module component (TIGR02574 family)